MNVIPEMIAGEESWERQFAEAGFALVPAVLDEAQSGSSIPVLQGWAEKEGELFVQPPEPVLEQLVAVRVHLDACTERDGPLRVVPGSHRLGRIASGAAVALRKNSAEVVCHLGQGGALVMRPLLLHASSKATGTSRRRVLHFLFGPRQLPHGLRWRQAVRLVCGVAGEAPGSLRSCSARPG